MFANGLRGMGVAMCSAALAFGCADSSEPADPAAERQETIDNLIAAGFPADDIAVHDGLVYLGNDAVVTLAASREMLQADDGHDGKEQYRTTNLVSPLLTRVCINAPGFVGVFNTALTNAINNYNALPLTFNLFRTTAPPPGGCQFTIQAVIQPGLVGGSAGFPPGGGVPWNQIRIGGGLSTFDVNTIEHVITHEIGHCFGLRHSDWFNRSISCGVGGAEVNTPPGAIHVPGTPVGAVVGGSLMNACFRTLETGEFTPSDVTALNFLY